MLELQAGAITLSLLRLLSLMSRRPTPPQAAASFCLQPQPRQLLRGGTRDPSWRTGQAGMASHQKTFPSHTKAQPPSGPDSEDICYPWLPVQPTQTDRMGIPVHTPSLSALIHAAGRRTFKRITTCPAVPRNPGPGTGALRLLWARRKLPAASDLLWEWPENVCKYLINPCYIIF